MWKQINSSIIAAVILAVSASFVLVGATFGQVVARTTITLDDPFPLGSPFNYAVDSIEIDWSTSETKGVIVESQLTELTFSLLQGTATVYTDKAIINSVVQPIGGVVRDIDDIRFMYDLDNLAGGLERFDNDCDPVQAGSAAGETFNIFGDCDSANLTAFSNGNFIDNSEFEHTFITVEVPAGDEFGGGINTFYIEFVTIGDPGNPADTTGAPNPAGTVGCTFRMGKFEISEDMIDKANAEGGLGITKDARGANKPATSVSWNEAARFVNWLNTSTGNAAAYKFEFQPGDVGYDVNAAILTWDPGDAGYNPNNIFRNSLARYVLPSFNEWYKAAYYDPTSGTYFDFPTGSNTAPTAVASGTMVDTAVFDQTIPQGPADVTLAGGLSPYGTSGQGGNVFEWEESEFDLENNFGLAARGLRGGGWSSDSGVLQSSVRNSSLFPGSESTFIGFRVASATPLVLGDANDDGVLDNLDITAFGQALFMPAAYAAAYPNVEPDCVLDMNNDGAFNNLDIAGFSSALGF